MLTGQQWGRYERLLNQVRNFVRRGEKLLFTSESLADLHIIFSGQLLRTENEEVILVRWEERSEEFLAKLHDAATELDQPTVQIDSQTYRIVSARVVDTIKGWCNDNCPSGVD